MELFPYLYKVAFTLGNIKIKKDLRKQKNTIIIYLKINLNKL